MAKSGAFAASPGKTRRAKATVGNGAAAKAKYGKKAAARKGCSSPMQPPALVWDKGAMKSLLNAVRAECLGEVTLNPVQDGGYLSRLVARVKAPTFQPTDGQISMKLFEWLTTYGGDQEAFEKCEMAVHRTDAAKRHEGIWASQAASVSRSAVGDDETRVKRVPRLSFKAAPHHSPTPAFDEPATASQTPPLAARCLPSSTVAKGKKRSPAEGDGSGKGKEPAEEGGQMDDKTSERRTRRKLVPEYPGEGSAAASPEKSQEKGAAADANETPSPRAAASRAATAEKKKKSPLTDAAKASAHCGGEGGGSSARSHASAAGALRLGGGGSSFKAGASRRLAWAAAGRSAASPSSLDPTAGVPGFLLRARKALREAGGAEKYAQENRSGANGRAALAEMLAERMSGCGDRVGVGYGSEAAGGKRAKAKVSQPALPLTISCGRVLWCIPPHSFFSVHLSPPPPASHRGRRVGRKQQPLP